MEKGDSKLLQIFKTMCLIAPFLSSPQSYSSIGVKPNGLKYGFIFTIIESTIWKTRVHFFTIMESTIWKTRVHFHHYGKYNMENTDSFSPLWKVQYGKYRFIFTIMESTIWKMRVHFHYYGKYNMENAGSFSSLWKVQYGKYGFIFTIMESTIWKIRVRFHHYGKYNVFSGVTLFTINITRISCIIA